MLWLHFNESNKTCIWLWWLSDKVCCMIVPNIFSMNSNLFRSMTEYHMLEHLMLTFLALIWLFITHKSFILHIYSYAEPSNGKKTHVFYMSKSPLVWCFTVIVIFLCNASFMKWQLQSIWDYSIQSSFVFWYAFICNQDGNYTVVLSCLFGGYFYVRIKWEFLFLFC